MRPIFLILSALLMSAAHAQTPQMVDWPFGFSTTPPSAVSAADLLDKPAGRLGRVIARDGHFYTGDRRIRFWGVNVCFGGNFPTHEQADQVANRLAHFGINAVRFHHMDNQRFPGGLFADASLTTLSPEAMDRLDYFVFALKQRGIYSNLNLHVSRTYPELGEKLDEFGKLIDLFHPRLIEAQKKFARDLLTHVNHYTHTRYADEPAVCMVEINNENTLFMWGAEQTLADLPPQHAKRLRGLWNQWLINKYRTTAALKKAWAVGELPLSDTDLLRKTAWTLEQQSTAKLAMEGHALRVLAVSGIDWHAQYHHPKLTFEKGKFYTLQFTVSADQPGQINVNAGQHHAPWQNLGLSAAVPLTRDPQRLRFGFAASATDDNARISFVVGQRVNTLKITDITLHEGGRIGLRDGEDLATQTVASHKPGDAAAPQRSADWFDFLQQTDEAYFVAMRDYLKNDLGVKAPITGTIGLGPLGTKSQSKMDFVDAHAYWDHPQFPRKAWDNKNWLIDNKPMVDNPPGATLWNLAATRVAGKPFTVTEYNHSAPNQWQAECVPMIASFAAMQDWDAVFLFAYSHNAQFNKQHVTSFFDIEGNALMMPYLPLAARMFLGQAGQSPIKPLRKAVPIGMDQGKLLATGSQFYFHQWRYLQEMENANRLTLLQQQFSITYDGPTTRAILPIDDNRLQWIANPKVPIDDGKSVGRQSGQYFLNDPHAVIFVGFTDGTIRVGPMELRNVSSQFVSLMLVPADPKQTIDKADRLLLSIAGRAENTDQEWNADRTTVNDRWGRPPVRIEPIAGDLSLPGSWTIHAITAQGTRGQAVNRLGDVPSVWYELLRQPR